MTVTWLTTIADIVNIVVIVKNTQSENEYSVVVGPNERTVKVDVDPASYTVTVVVFDICKKNYSSISETVHVYVESSSASLSGTTPQSTPSSLTTFERTTSSSHCPTPTSHCPTPTSCYTMSSPHMSSSHTPGSSKQCVQGNAGKGMSCSSCMIILALFNHRFYSSHCTGHSVSADYNNIFRDFAIFGVVDSEEEAE